MAKTRRQNIENVISDTCGRFLYYDRKESESLGLDDLEEAVDADEITVDEIVGLFESHLRRFFS